MKGVAHLSLSLLSLTVILLPLGPTLSWPLLLCAYAGIFVGSLAPDVDAPDSVMFHLRMLPRRLRVLLSFFAYLLRYLVYWPLSFFFWMVFFRNYRHEHRGLLHTPVGVSLASLLVFAYGWILIFVVRSASITLYLAFVGSFWAGCILHLLQDSCTPTGIAWGYPFSTGRMKGTIRTGDQGDFRPLLYAGILLGCLAVLYLLIDNPFPPVWLVAIFLLMGSWFFFLFLARTTRGQPNVY